MTEKTLDWLNQNRFRAYPFVNDHGIIFGKSRIPDCVVLDCLVTDTRNGIGTPSMEFTRIEVNDSSTTVFFTYDGMKLSHTIESGLGGKGQTVRVSGNLMTGEEGQFVHFGLVFSSHDYILEHAGKGTWSFAGSILQSRIISVEASGVSGIKTNGSSNVNPPGEASGNVHLVDGYRTQPVISNGKVIVKVGTQYGIDPCHYPYPSSDDVSCNDVLLFFCGQNAINSGNSILSGGPGVTVTQGSNYTAKSDIYDTYGKIGIEKGETVPCIEVIAASELLRIYRPSGSQSSSGSGSSDSN